MLQQELLHPALRFADLRVKFVFPIKGTTKLYAEWDNDDEAVVDFKNAIQTVKGFKPLENPEIFEKVHIESWGICIEWTDQIDFGSDTLRQMAEEQGSVFKRLVA